MKQIGKNSWIYVVLAFMHIEPKTNITYTNASVYSQVIASILVCTMCVLIAAFYGFSIGAFVYAVFSALPATSVPSTLINVTGLLAIVLTLPAVCAFYIIKLAIFVKSRIRSEGVIL